MPIDRCRVRAILEANPPADPCEIYYRQSDADRVVLGCLESPGAVRFDLDGDGEPEAVREIRGGWVSVPDGERTNAALLLSRTTPISDRAEASLERALQEGTEAERRIIQSALDAYRKRKEAEKKADRPGPAGATKRTWKP